MAMTQCAECGEGISDTAVMCPHCGAPPEVALADAVEPAAPGDLLEAAIREALHLPEGDLGAAELAKVESLKLDGTEVADWGAVTTELKALPNLKMLGLRATGLTDAAPLAELTGLRYLYLEKNAISSAGPLCEMKLLKQLWLYGNPLPREEVILLEQALPRCEVFI